MRSHHLPLLGLLACAAPARTPVRPGIEVLLADSLALVAHRRVGLLTNQTGVDRAGRRDVDLLRGLVTVLFSPEHGFAGTEDRPDLPDATDSSTGLPIYSLYRAAPAAALAALDRVDVLVVDLQDIGARYYTYAPLAAWFLGEAARRDKPVVVLDRPDPLGGLLVQGNVAAPARRGESGPVAVLPVPMRPGMTIGELLRFANDALGLGARLTVVPAAGWRRAMFYDETGLPWVRPSPNMPDLESALHYPGLCLFEGTNLSVGRGTPVAFQVVGAPWLDTTAVLGALRRGDPGWDGALRGVAVSGVVFVPHAPSDGKYDGVPLPGLRLRVTDRRHYDPTKAAVVLLAALRAVHGDSLRFRAEHFDRLAAGPALREAVLAGRPPAEIWGAWTPALAAFVRARARYLLY
jgi:uncharacterized protein YbbC (DUF1343 family)